MWGILGILTTIGIGYALAKSASGSGTVTTSGGPFHFALQGGRKYLVRFRSEATAESDVLSLFRQTGFGPDVQLKSVTYPGESQPTWVAVGTALPFTKELSSTDPGQERMYWIDALDVTGMSQAQVLAAVSRPLRA